MTFKEVKDFLNRGYKIKERIRAKEERITFWQDIATSTTAQLKPVYSKNASTPTSKVETACLYIYDLENEIRDDILALVRIESEIDAVIKNSTLDTTDQTILEMRYQNCMTWEDIAIKLNYAYRWVLRRHNRSIYRLTENWPLKAT